MLGKQWLNRYASTDVRGTAVERSQNRQRKLDGIVAWYFDPVMELLPLMLQASLLLLGCALSRYLWGVDITVASVVIGVTSSGIILYIFIVVAGAASKSCPYQTPGSHAIRCLRPKVQSVLRSATSLTTSACRGASRKSETIVTIRINARRYHPWWSRGEIGPFFRDAVLEIPRAVVNDVYRLGRAVILTFVTFPAGAYYLCFMIAGSLVSFFCRVHHWLRGTSSTPERGADHRAIVLDLRCILWMIQTSLDKAVHLSTLKYLAMMGVLANFNPALATDCFGIFVGCINVENHRVVIVKGLEHLATASATCFLRTLHYISITDPTSSVLIDLRRSYVKVFPFGTDFEGLPFYYAMVGIQAFVDQRWRFPRRIQWSDYVPSTQEQIPVARGVAKVARAEYQKGSRSKVPCRILRFALHSLSLNPPPPTPVVADCLSIIAIDLGCDAPETRSTTPDERYVHTSHTQMTIILNLNQCTSGASLEPDSSET